MKKLYTIQEIENLSYTDFISLIKEENRPSGGKKTIREIVNNSFINNYSKVLEIGSTNGFSSLEISKLVSADVTGIDINLNSIKNANERIEKNGLDGSTIRFEYGNAEELKYDNNCFDLIISGNALSFIGDKNKAISEMIRVLKPNGFISIVPIWYKKNPDKNIIDKVNEQLGFKIKCTTEDDWVDFSKYGLELYYKKNYSFVKANDEQIDNYINNMINSKNHLKLYDNDALAVIKKRWKKIISIFNDNLAMTNYSVILLRKTLEPEEEEIFLTEEV